LSNGDGCATATPCGCCEAPAPATPGHDVAVSKTGSRPGPLRVVGTRKTIPSGRCVCGTERPAAPEPRPSQKPTDNRTSLASALGLSHPALLGSPDTLARSSPLAASPPQHTPLYLRTSRLLI